MTENAQFLPVEIQTSVQELRALGVSENALGRLVTRILQASEAKVTSLQMSIVQIEESITLRLDRLADKLEADQRTQFGATNEIVMEVRSAQMDAHPKIAALQETLEDLDIPANRARINAALDDLEARVTRLEQAAGVARKT